MSPFAAILKNLGITVAEALETPALSGAVVLAGHERLDAPIENVAIAEDLARLDFVDRGDLLITAGYALRGREPDHVSLVELLHARGVGALLFRVGEIFDNVPQPIVDTASRLGFPLIALNTPTRYGDIMRGIYEGVLNRELRYYRRLSEMHSRFFSIALSGGGLDQLCQSLSDLVGHRRVLLADSAGLVVAAAGGSGPGDANSGDAGSGATGSGAAALSVPNQLPSAALEAAGRPPRGDGVWVSAPGGGRLFVCPVGAGEPVAGYLAIRVDQGDLDDHDIIAIQQASTVAQLEFVKAELIEEAEGRARGELINDLISGQFRVEYTAPLLRELLGVVAHGQFYVFLIDLHDLVRVSGDELADTSTRNACNKVVGQVLAGYSGPVLTQLRSDTLLGLAQVKGESQARRLGAVLEQATRTIRGRWPIAPTVGVSGPGKGLDQVPRCYQEALSALGIGRDTGLGGQVVWFQELGARRLLFELRGNRVAEQLWSETVGLLSEHDRKTGGDLLQTLATYLKGGGSLRGTAEVMHLHKNSVRHRLSKVQALTGLDPRNPEDYFTLWCGVKLAEVLAGETAQSHTGAAPNLPKETKGAPLGSLNR